MKKKDFNNLATSIKQAGKIKGMSEKRITKDILHLYPRDFWKDLPDCHCAEFPSEEEIAEIISEWDTMCPASCSLAKEISKRLRGERWI